MPMRTSIGITCVAACTLASLAPAARPGRGVGVVTVSVTAGAPANPFVRARAVGAGVDGHEKGEIARFFTPANIRAMRSAGLASLTYRLRTELGVEAWHWNETGSWSRPGRKEGYWTSAVPSSAPISL